MKKKIRIRHNECWSKNSLLGHVGNFVYTVHIQEVVYILSCHIKWVTASWTYSITHKEEIYKGQPVSQVTLGEFPYLRHFAAKM